MTTTKPFPEELKKTPKKKKKRIKYKNFASRDFLNLPGSHGDALISVNLFNRIGIRITDCENEINLYESFGSVKGRKNAFHKVSTLIKHLTDLKDHMESEFKRNNVRYK